MSVLVEVFKRIQLFFFAFSLAASSMMFVGMASGNLDRGTLYLGLAEKMATYFAANTSLLDLLVGDEKVVVVDARHNRTGYRTPIQSVPRGAAPNTARDSLQALKLRQRQRIVVTDELNTDG
jgi:hypothetical protein